MTTRSEDQWICLECGHKFGKHDQWFEKDICGDCNKILHAESQKCFYYMIDQAKQQYLLYVHEGIALNFDGSLNFENEIFFDEVKFRAVITDLLNDGYREIVTIK